MSRRSALPGYLAVVAFLFCILYVAHAATISISPNTGTFSVGSTFDVSVFLDTQNQSVNVIDLYLQFPPDELQVVSPSVGQSIISVWTSPFQYDNIRGAAHFQGGIPGGINVSSGLISTLKFRVRKIGVATVKISGDSKALLNDGNGTNALENTQDGIFSLILPPPAGPIIASPTHPDQSRWYSDSTVTFTWASDASVEGYSYMLDGNPISVPDDVVKGTKTSIAYSGVSDGTHYFHIKALRGGVWGGTSHFAVNIDSAPPADFPIGIQPSQLVTDSNLLFSFSTTDSQSGINHYEYAAVLVSAADAASIGEAIQPFFAEAGSPVELNLGQGTYDIIVRAYDNAGNLREETKRIYVANSFLAFFLNPWTIGVSIALLLLLSYIGWHMRKLHLKSSRITDDNIPKSIASQIRELKKYRERYGKMSMFFLILSASLILGTFVNGTRVNAAILPVTLAQSVQPNISVSPPVITTVSGDISNDEIFYIGGTTAKPNTAVLIYLQNMAAGEIIEEATVSDSQGKWFYRHNSFLNVGKYIIWVEAKSVGSFSPPSSQKQLNVTPTAIQFGSSRLSYETLYIGLSILLFLAAIGLALFLVFRGLEEYKKHRRFSKEIKEAEEAVRRGFAVIKHDIEMELEVIKKAKFSRKLSAEEKEKEFQLLKDLDKVQNYIGKEVFDIEQIEFGG